jgi:hypothetical protein
MNPTAILKIFGAMAPLFNDPTVGEQLVAEIRAMFDSIRRTEERIAAIEDTLIALARELPDELAKLQPKGIMDLTDYDPAETERRVANG